MFLEFFGLHEQPFGVTPDPRFLYFGAQHREALASLLYGTETGRGFLALIAPPGMGKTSLLFQFLEVLRSDARKARAAFIFQTDCQPRELLRHILADLGLDAAGMDLPAMHAALNQMLVAEMNAGRRFVLVIDEAQNLEERALESVRLLSNFETPWMKLMQIVIAGQPQLAARLARPSMAQLRQRISAVVRLEPFSADETADYIAHRLWVAGYEGASPFTAGATLLVAEHSGGIPRNINNLCFNAMSLAYAMGTRKIDTKIVREVIADLEIAPLARAAEPPSGSTRAPARASVPFGSSLVAGQSGRFSRTLPASLAAAFLALAAASGFFLRGAARAPEIAQAAPRQAPAATASVAAPISQPLEAPANHLEPMSLAGTAAAGEERSDVLTVVVPAGATLRHLSLEYLGRFDLRALVEISALNPQIPDPGHIEAGQQIRMPLYLRRETASAGETAEARTLGTLGGRP